MTSLSQYLKAERPDLTEPASFYAPGAEDWHNKAKIARAIALRSRAPEVVMYPAEPEDVIEH